MHRRPMLLTTLLLLAVFGLAPQLAHLASRDVRAAPPGTLFLPAAYQAPSPTPPPTYTPSVTPTPDALVWDPRLDERGAMLVPAEVQPGEWYWRLTKGVWYAEHEPPFDGQHHIFADTLESSGVRQPGVRIRITSLDGATVHSDITTELKTGDLYAANFPMWVTAPAYRAVPLADAPADAVTGLGMGTIEEPWRTSHTSYGFVWQWSQAAEETATPTPAATPSTTPTPTIAPGDPGVVTPAVTSSPQP